MTSAVGISLDLYFDNSGRQHLQQISSSQGHFAHGCATGAEKMRAEGALIFFFKVTRHLIRLSQGMRRNSVFHTTRTGQSELADVDPMGGSLSKCCW